SHKIVLESHQPASIIRAKNPPPKPQSRPTQTNKNTFLFSLSRPSSHNQTTPISPIPVPTSTRRRTQKQQLAHPWAHPETPVSAPVGAPRNIISAPVGAPRLGRWRAQKRTQGQSLARPEAHPGSVVGAPRSAPQQHQNSANKTFLLRYHLSRGQSVAQRIEHPRAAQASLKLTCSAYKL
ncbi:hypothetical protein Tsubulata_004765, partial [Turnera subulata]